jgi:hypothetical protein
MKVKDCTLQQIIEWGRKGCPTSRANPHFDVGDAEAMLMFCDNFDCLDMELDQASACIGGRMRLVTAMLEDHPDRASDILHSAYSGLKDGQIAPLWKAN